MDINKIRTIVNTSDSVISDVNKRGFIIQAIADDPKAIPDILEILNKERSLKRELISEMNALLSKSDAALDKKSLNKEKFIQKEVQEFYTKWSDFVRHNWKTYKPL